MMRPKGIRGLADRFRDWPLRLRIIAGAGAGLVLVAVLMSALLTLGGGSGDGDPGAAGDDSDLAVDFGDGDDAPAAVVEADAVPEPTLTLEERVKATVEAMNPDPEPTEVPTPDVAATLAAEVAASRGGGGRMGRQVNPLDAGGVRNPYLTERDINFIAAMGEDLWVATQLYLRLSEVAARDYTRLTASHLRERQAFIDGLLAGLPDYDHRDLSSSGLNELVVNFVGFVDGGIRQVERAVGELRGLIGVFDEAGAETVADLNSVQRDLLRQRYLLLNELLLDFYKVMSSYGCSACGELFRSPFILE